MATLLYLRRKLIYDEYGMSAKLGDNRCRFV